MIIPKSKKEITNEIKQVVSSKTGLNATQEGTVVGAIIDSFSEEMSNMYSTLKIVQDQAYLSTAQGNYVDLLAELMNVERKDYESDVNLKARTTEAVYQVAGGNIVAIRSALDAIQNVSDYEIQEYSNGPGSFTIYVYPSTSDINELSLIREVRETIAPIVSEGIFFEVKCPEGVTVDLSVILSFKSGLSEIEKKDLRQKVKTNLSIYINDLKKGEVLVINEIIQRTMTISENIQDMGIANLVVNGKNQLIVNTFPKSNEEFRVGDIIVG